MRVIRARPAFVDRPVIVPGAHAVATSFCEDGVGTGACRDRTAARTWSRSYSGRF